jgi:ABC-2 type transport system ATP-binding protein
MIRVEGLTKDYGPRRAIENISFDAQKGEILGFLGPNGAGKTTTMRILCGYMPPTAGKAEVAGFDVVDKSLEVRKRVGYMPESVPLYPDMTVFDYLKYMADLRRVPEAEESVEDVIDMLHLEERIDSFISSLSKGMRQRVGLAQALLHDPEVLILDEPTIGLDPAQIKEVRNMIQEIGRERTVMLSTHILSEAQQICDRVLIINKGHIVAEDAPEQLQARITGAKQILIKIGNDPDGVEAILTGLSEITKIIKSKEGIFTLEAAPGKDPRPEIARRLVNGGFDLLEMHATGASLEDIFLQLTRDEPAAPEYAEFDVFEENEVDQDDID